MHEEIGIPELNVYLNQMSPTSLMNNINLENFKPSSLLQGADGRLHRATGQFEEEKGARSSSPIMIQEALRLPNISLKSVAESILQVPVVKPKDGFASPTNILEKINPATIYDNL
jgi:hypothetical protein